MSDLRDQTHKPAQTADDLVFLDYHEQSPWAKAKVAAGLRLTPEALVYMQNEIDARGLRKKLYDEQLEKEKAETTNGAGKVNGNEETPHAGSHAPDAQDSADVQCGGTPDDAGHGANLQRPAGEGSGGAGQADGSAEGQQGAGAHLEPEAAARPPAGNV